ncbi:MAG: PEP-utilizing enzyme [bacterium]
MISKNNNSPRYEYTHLFLKVMNRPIDLFDCERWDIGERIMLPKKYKDLLSFDPMFIYSPGKGVSVYYDYSDPEQSVQPLIHYLENNLSWYREIEQESQNNCDELKKLIHNESNDTRQLLDLILDISPTQAISNLLGGTDSYEVSNELREISIRIRDYSDKIFHLAIAYLSNIMTQKVGVENASFVLMSELLEDKAPSQDTIDQRKKGWIYHRGNMLFDARQYAQDVNIMLVQKVWDTDEKITGQIACKGTAEGRAKIIFELSDLDKVKKGDILVAPMTTPDMMVAIGIASAIVTDEGGITCHAAIVSRESGIPCVVSTGNATEIIKDGDLIRVDANNGVVEIIKLLHE